MNFLLVFFCDCFISISAQTIEIPYAIRDTMSSKEQIASQIYVCDDVFLNGRLIIRKEQTVFAKVHFGEKYIKIHFDYVRDNYGNAVDFSVDDFVVTGEDCMIPAGAMNMLKVEYPYSFEEKTFWNNFLIGDSKYIETSLKAKIDKQNDGVVGIYEAASNNGCKLGCIKENDTYKLIYMGEGSTTWKSGEVKAILRPTAQTGFYKADWYMSDKSKNTNCYISFDGVTMKTLIEGDEVTYLKMYPTASVSSHSGEWSGTGFALNSGYVVTNHHVIDGANVIEIYGVKGDFNNPYTATVVASDKNNDLALLKISDNRFTGFGTIPYKVKTTQSEVGETISVLGYPLTSTMGDEIKLTTGVISSKTGFQGDVSLYQISAAVQPGNSGGPLFDNYGNIIGIVSSKHTGAENVGYAVKATYLRDLVESYTNTSILPSNTSLSGLTLPEKVKKSKNFIFMIQCK